MYLGSSMVPANGIPTKGTITALDVKTNKIAWQVKLDNMPYSGALVTKGGFILVETTMDALLRMMLKPEM